MESSMKKWTTIFLITAQAAVQGGAFAEDLGGAIQPYAANPRYWEYKGAPVLLLGGSKDDSLFQIPGLKAHLDEIQAAGGNVIRNTMSARPDHGFEVYAYTKLENGKYDLDQWNDEYWRRFENLLEWTHERGIIVQIEVWDRFDYSQENWAESPWRPANNVNYTTKESGLAGEYPVHAWRDQQPFFHSIPGMPRYKPVLDKMRGYQERRVAKMLSYSLKYPNVLYCMNNETSTPPQWGRHWMRLIEKTAGTKGAEVYVTDMFDDGWAPRKSSKIRGAIEHPGLYPFIDISQVNSRAFNEAHWDNVMWVMRQLDAAPRPLNNTKIYSDGETSWGSGTPVDGVERFWRNLIAGAASCRFHRPGGGIGLNDTAKACIQAARKLETRLKRWDVSARQDLLSERESDEAYLAAKPGESYALFFTDGGEVLLDLKKHSRGLQPAVDQHQYGRVGRTKRHSRREGGIHRRPRKGALGGGDHEGCLRFMGAEAVFEDGIPLPYQTAATVELLPSIVLECQPNDHH